MVRRAEIVAIPRDASPADVQRILLEEGHSRMTVYDSDLDNVVGYIVARDVLALAWEGALVSVADIIRPMFAVPLNAKISVVLRDMQTRRSQIAIVVDEHSGVAGLVTMEDLMEELVGDIVDENEEPEQILRRQPDGSVLVPGWLPVRKLNRALDLGLPISKESTTVAGLCMALALSVPPAGARLQATDGTTIEIVDASPRRVRMVRISRPRAAGEVPSLA